MSIYINYIRIENYVLLITYMKLKEILINEKRFKYNYVLNLNTFSPRIIICSTTIILLKLINLSKLFDCNNICLD